MASTLDVEFEIDKNHDDQYKEKKRYTSFFCQ
jgi:hypothetical protein